MLELCDKPKLLEREQHWIDTLNCVRPKGYNLNPTAGSNIGRVFSEEFRIKARIRQTGKQHSEETKQRMASHWTEERRKKQSDIAKKWYNKKLKGDL